MRRAAGGWAGLMGWGGSAVLARVRVTGRGHEGSCRATRVTAAVVLRRRSKRSAGASWSRRRRPRRARPAVRARGSRWVRRDWHALRGERRAHHSRDIAALGAPPAPCAVRFAPGASPGDGASTRVFVQRHNECIMGQCVYVCVCAPRRVPLARVRGTFGRPSAPRAAGPPRRCLVRTDATRGAHGVPPLPARRVRASILILPRGELEWGRITTARARMSASAARSGGARRRVCCAARGRSPAAASPCPPLRRPSARRTPRPGRDRPARHAP